MPEENEKIEDFISLWKKKIASENKSSVIGDSINRIKELQKENENLKKKIAENLQLITKSEDMLKSVIQEKEKLKLEKQETLTELTLKRNELEQENLNLNNKVKSMVKILLEKDEQIKQKDDIINNLQINSIPKNIKQEDISNKLMEELKSELAKKKNQIISLEERINQLQLENENLNSQIIEKMHNMPIDFVAPVNPLQNNAIKPLPPQNMSLPLETLCQDLQTDLNKYKRIVEKLTEEKSQLRRTLEEKGFQFNLADLEQLKNENELLKQDLVKVQQSLKNKETEVTHVAMRQVESKIKELENKLKEKDSIIANLKLSQPSLNLAPTSSMSGLIEDLQNQINKMKISVKEKDQKILELTQQLTKI